ncbi:MAG: ABC transporter substrate-binding protein [Defluviitaleaceae bacterium]|nr:ABC transporter substrate-binding protein [Defluviitaleaceae bacterium]
MKLAYKRAAAVAVALVMLAACARGSAAEDGVSVVRLNQVVHSIFYAPQYVAMELGFFAEYGIVIELDTGNGADRSMTALLSGNADIGLMGTEASFYVFNEGREDFAVPFAQLTAKAGNFLVAREPMPGFTWDDVRGRTIIGGRLGGMPQMVLEYILREQGIEPGADVEILSNLAFTTTAAAFTGGVGDFTAEFDPSAFMLEQAGIGYVVASLGEAGGAVPYTVYMATRSFISENPQTVQNFTNAVRRAQIWMHEHSAYEAARVIAPHFPENTYDELAVMIQRYKDIGAWPVGLTIEREGFELLQDIMEQSGELSRRVDFDGFVDNSFAETAMEQ